MSNRRDIFNLFIPNATGTLVFDSSGSAQTIQPGQLGIMMYDGSRWR